MQYSFELLNEISNEITFRLFIIEEYIQAIDEIRSIEGIPTDSHAESLTWNAGINNSIFLLACLIQLWSSDELLRT